MVVTKPKPRTDAEIQRAVLEELRWDPRVDESEVGVQVERGIVTLAGKITSYAKKKAAEEAAHRVLGVLDVANDLEVLIPGAEGRIDKDIAEAVRRALTWNIYVPEERVHTTVSNGWVTLAGEVEWAYQREDAAKAVERLAGVRGVTNDIVVRGRRVDPAAIRTSIENALERQAEREARHLSIEVDGGAVTLGGTVRSWGEKRAVESSAWFAAGVQQVINHLVVDPYA